MLNRKTAPPIKDAIEFELKLKPYQKHVLPNGAIVYAIDAGAQEVVQVEWLFFAGNCFEEKNMVAAATNFMLKNGTSTRTAFELNEQFDFYGAHCTRTCGNETASITLHTLSKHLPALLPVVKEMIVDPVFPEEELNVFKQNSLQRLMVNLQKCDFVAGRLIDSYVYGNRHPYGKFYVADDYTALQPEELKAFHKKYYLQGNCIIFVAGKLPADLFDQLDATFGDIPFSAQALPGSDLAYQSTTNEHKHRIQNDPNGVQGAIRIAREFPNRHHPDFTKMMVLNTLFGGYFGSRLMSNIREDKGYTYGIHSFVQNHISPSALVISTEAGKDVCEAAITEVYKEMRLLQTELVDEEELLLVRNYLIGSILGDLDGPFHIIGRWKNIILNQHLNIHTDQ